MKRSIVGALVGAIIIFVWQFLSFGLLDLHRKGADYTDKQGTILKFLQDQGLQEGSYRIPNSPANASNAEMEKMMKDSDGQPWVMVQYHNKAENNMNAMTMNMIRGLLVNIVIVLLLCWIIRRMAAPGFVTILTASLAVGLIAFLNEPYTGYIWYKTFDIWMYFLDAIVAWGLTGLWLGWWMRRGRRELSNVRVGDRKAAMA